MISGIASITSYSDLLFVFYTVLHHKVFGRIGCIAVFVAYPCAALAIRVYMKAFSLAANFNLSLPS